MNCFNIPNTYFGHTIHQAPMIGSMASRKDGTTMTAILRRFLRSEDHDTAFVDAAIAKAMGE